MFGLHTDIESEYSSAYAFLVEAWPYCSQGIQIVDNRIKEFHDTLRRT